MPWNLHQQHKKAFVLAAWRSREERFYWHQMDEVNKRKTIQRCKTRWQKLTKARGMKMDALSLSTAELPYGMQADDIQPSLYHFEESSLEEQPLDDTGSEE